MKMIRTFAMCIIVMANLVACSNNLKDPVYPNSISFNDYDSLRTVREENPIDDSYLEALNGFSYSIASKILSSQPENISFSPTSLYMTLSLAATGANGATQDEILSVLGLSGKGTDFLSTQNSNLYRLLYTDNKIGKLKIANSLWLKKDMAFKDAFITNAVQNFYASIHNIDFTDDNAAELMSQWISKNTNGILAPKINVDQEQIMSIINTIYFKDEWVDKFNKDYSEPDTFYLSDGSEIECDFMNRTYLTHGYLDGEGFTSSSLGLKNSGNMVFILPDKGVSIDDLLATPQKVASLFNTENIESGKVIFQIPKFSFGNGLDLKEIIKTMGVVTAFKGDADFKGITDDKAFISGIKQQTHIAIDENGVEAAAFTQIDFAGSAPPNGKIAEMILDRPFIFAITSNNGVVLFVGIVNNPAGM
ncbi:MAG: serpin family protein [Lutisporaceae bacterium]